MVDPGSPTSQESPHSEDGGNHGGSSGVREQDRFLPIANISRIMKKALPANAKIAKDAKETVQECVSEFISFITSEASDKCQREKRKTINGDDLLWAMSTLGFEDYVEPLKLYLQKFREIFLFLLAGGTSHINIMLQIEGDKGAIANKGGAEQSARKEGSTLSVPPPVQMGHSSFYNSGMGYLQAQMQ
ncbi:hypothetical protein O6H91_06G065800 [Diphasiastrum complanatum]|uniref:Uncharacterized protein n=1 Tax=Diphasiastrum complanatum TaxID=34168 RepID=A0ACC2DEF4_DIPCM|nr:hypothetical protein O6H91_06G065800 [Diphasiastrum complanatum]